MNWEEWIIKNWKSTSSGILTVTLVTTVGLLTYPPIMQHPRTMAILGGIQVVTKLWIALISKDASK